MSAPTEVDETPVNPGASDARGAWGWPQAREVRLSAVRWALLSFWYELGNFKEAPARHDPVGGSLRYLLLTFLSLAQGLAKLTMAGALSYPVRLHRSRWSLLDDAIECAELSVPKGVWIECGVASGASINYIAQRTGMEVWGFDSFEGLPKDWVIFLPRGSFGTHGKPPAVEPNVRLVKGWFEDTLPPFSARFEGQRIALLHIDSDLYESARAVLSLLAAGIGKGTVIVFDEFCSALPDDEMRAFREVARLRGWRSRYLGCAARATGSLPVSIQIL